MNIKLDIPEEFFNGEERSGYYVAPEMKKVWAVQLDLISEFARVCEKHNLKWFADGGTLLGAARHKGFIPWDDDVDLIMMRKDFMRLCEVANKEFEYPYHFVSPNDREGVQKLMPFAKLYNNATTMLEWHEKLYLEYGIKVNYSQGIYIDIFILDDLPDDEKELQAMLERAHKLAVKSYNLYRLEIPYKPSPKILLRIVKFLLFSAVKVLKKIHINLPPYEKYFKEYNSCIHSCNNPESKKVGQLAFIRGRDRSNTNIWDRSGFDEIIYMPFEMLTLPVDKGYEKRLTQLYGDWHKFVIQTGHSSFYDTERPYTYYFEKHEN